MAKYKGAKKIPGQPSRTRGFTPSQARRDYVRKTGNVGRSGKTRRL